ncbi:MAG: hypothetical protein ACI4R8_04630 [Candidatus Caccovivens sp.]
MCKSKKHKINWKTFGIASAIIISVLLCAANIVLSCFYRSNDGANIFTAVSGWVSGISTIVLGVVAVKQNKKYKQENDEFNKKQEELIRKQYDFEVYKNIVDTRRKYVEKIKQDTNEFCQNFNYMIISSKLASMHAFKEQVGVQPSIQINEFDAGIVTPYLDLKQSIANDWNKKQTNDDLIKTLDNYFLGIKVGIKGVDYYHIENSIKQFNEKMSPLYLELLENKNRYITELDVDLNMILTNKSEDVNFLKEHYSYLKEKNNG